MQELIGQAEELRTRWTTIYAAADNPASLRQQVPNALAGVIEQSLISVENRLQQSQAKSESTPGDLITKSMAAVFLPQLLATMSELEAGRLGQLAHFVNDLIHLQTSILTAETHANHGESIT